VIRPATSEDTAAIAGLAVATGMFAPEDAGFVTAMMDAYFAGADAEGHACVVDDDGEGPVAVAYFQPEAAADRVWDLTMIAVRPDLQGTGRGIALLAHVETAVREGGARLLLIETSGTRSTTTRGRSTCVAATTRRPASGTTGPTATTSSCSARPSPTAPRPCDRAHAPAAEDLSAAS
jgi:GNAT superfamily N-acetyltransferase